LEEKRPTPPRMIRIRTAIVAFLFISSALPKLLCKGKTYPKYNRIGQACGFVKVRICYCGGSHKNRSTLGGKTERQFWV